MAMTKILLVLFSLFAQQYAATPPHTPPVEQLREQHGLEHTAPYIVTFGRVLLCSWAIFQISVLLALSDNCLSSLVHPILPLLPASVTSNPATFVAPSPIFLVGTILTVTGCLLRAYCFHMLGPRFTFQLSIRPSHTLVTKGVYGVVRHPSYTGAIICAVGWLLCLLDLRPWVVDLCGIHFPTWMPSHGNWKDGKYPTVALSALACLSVTVFGFLCAVLRERMHKEDAMLEKHFGDEWRAWAKRVPYRLVPGVC